MMPTKLARAQAAQTQAQKRAEAAIRAGDAQALQEALATADAPDYARLWHCWGNHVADDPQGSESTMDALLPRTPDAILKESRNEALRKALCSDVAATAVEKLLARGCRAEYMDLGWVGCRKDPTHVPKLVGLLIAHGANPDGGACLLSTLNYHAAAYTGAEVALALQHALMSHGANPNPIHAWSGEPFLCQLAREGLIKEDYAIASIRQAISFGANPTCFTREGYSPLAYAIAFDRPKMVHALIDLGADPRRPVDGVSSSALNFGVECGAFRTVLMLRATGAYPKVDVCDALKIERKRPNPRVREALRRPQNKLAQEGAGRTWLFSALKDTWRTTTYAVRRACRRTRH